MCANGVDLGHTCRLCGKPLLSCWDDGPSISWHGDEADALACSERKREDYRRSEASLPVQVKERSEEKHERG